METGCGAYVHAFRDASSERRHGGACRLRQTGNRSADLRLVARLMEVGLRQLGTVARNFGDVSSISDAALASRGSCMASRCRRLLRS